ncbi:hypothetical protein EMIHUDRAFT_447054, partial [Emiliania huxleyi CCMP1516]|uniref:Uncharacterized protein n=2 Tax=Emiliania huxleyi TaxID=2903 RepID=A0A0D3KH03_EMIH1
SHSRNVRQLPAHLSAAAAHAPCYVLARAPARASSSASHCCGADRFSSALASSRALGTLRRASLCGAPVSCWPERKAPRARASSGPSLQLGVPLLRSRSSSVGALEEPSSLACGRRRCRTVVLRDIGAGPAGRGRGGVGASVSVFGRRSGDPRVRFVGARRGWCCCRSAACAGVRRRAEVSRRHSALRWACGTPGTTSTASGPSRLPARRATRRRRLRWTPPTAARGRRGGGRRGGGRRGGGRRGAPRSRARHRPRRGGAREPRRGDRRRRRGRRRRKGRRREGARGSRPSGSRPSPAASLEGEHLEYLRRRGAPWGEPPVAGAAAPPEGARRRARIVDFWPGGALDTYRLRSRRRARRRAGWPWSARRGGCAARTRASLHAACRRNDSSAARLFLRRDG